MTDPALGLLPNDPQIHAYLTNMAAGKLVDAAQGGEFVGHYNDSLAAARALLSGPFQPDLVSGRATVLAGDVADTQKPAAVARQAAGDPDDDFQHPEYIDYLDLLLSAYQTVAADPTGTTTP